MRQILDFYRSPLGMAFALLGVVTAAMLWGFGLPAEGMSTALILNAANLRDVYRGFKAQFQEGFNGVSPAWDQIATLVPSTTAEEHYGWLGEWPRLREWLGDRHVKSLAAHDYTIRNRKFESSVGVPRDAIEDDRYGVYGPLMREMGNAAATHPDELVFGLLSDGFSTACYDGQYFFDSDHPVGGQSVSNYQSGAGNPWFILDTNRALKPLIFQRRRDYALRQMTAMDDEAVFMRDEFRYGVDARVNVGFGFWQMAYGSQADLTAANFNAALAAMMAFQSDEGRPLGIQPSLIVCGPSNRAAALEVVQAERDANGATNINRNAVQVLVTPWLP